MMLSKEERDAIQARLSALPSVSASPANNSPADEATDEHGDFVFTAKEWIASLLAHAEAADEEIARLNTELERERTLRERAEKGMDFFASGDWSI